MEQVGRPVRRKEGRAKVTGEALYVDDVTQAGMLHGVTVRSSIPRGRITAVRFDPAVDWSEYVVVTAADIPGRNVVKLIADDQPYLASDRVNHPEEPIVLIAHADRARADDAARRVTVEYEPLPPVLSIDDSLARRDVIWGEDNIFKSYSVAKGDVDAAFGSEGAVIVEGVYETGAQEQLYIEPMGMLAVASPRHGVTVWGSMQCPYYVHTALAGLFKMPAERIRVVQMETGGGFGGKEEYPSVIAGHAALLALKAGRPVKLVYDRVEDLLATTKRHPAIIRHRTGVKRDGRLTAIDIDAVFDGGAYATLSAVVLSRGMIHATGPYRCDHVRIRGRAMMTNTPPNGAFRGFGAPQTQFAAEVHMDRIAEALQLDPVRVREINAFRPGDLTATGQRLGKDCSALPVLREAVKRTNFKQKRRSLKGSGRGIGLSLFFHGSGFTGSGEVKLASKASLVLTERGARILAASTEIGQGTRTMLAQIAADTLGVAYDAIDVNEADTRIVPDSGPTVASRTCMIVGRLVQRAAEDLKARLGTLTPKQYLRKHGPLTVTAQYEKPAEIAWDDANYRGDAYESYGWGCDVVEVHVDPVTWQVTPTAFTTVHEIGRAIHPGLAQGQIEGGSAQGIGYAILEDVVMRDGRMANSQLTNYIIPTTLDTPHIDVVVLENAYTRGPFGAKGVGEMPIDGPAPAVVNAIRHAGVDVREIPATPEKIMACALR